MADDSKTGTIREMATYGQMRVVGGTVEVASTASAGSVYTLATAIPTSARVWGQSPVAWDQLANTGAPTLDVGFKRRDKDGPTDYDALLNGLDVTSAATTAVSLIDDHADWGKTVWELAGLSADPQTVVDVVFVLQDAAVNVGGTISACVVYSVN